MHAETPKAPVPAVEPEEEEKAEAAQDAIEREKAYNEAVKIQETRKKRLEGLSAEARQRLREREVRLPNADDGYSWQNEADAYQLTGTERALLEKQKFAVGSREFRQSFEPYDHPKGPVFITSDSLLNAFHVLFEDSFRELEIRRAGQLKDYLEQLVTGTRKVLPTLTYPAEEWGPSWRHAQLAVGPAMRLLGTPLEFFDESERRAIEEEVTAIREAKATRLPEWLKPATGDLVAIDYGRFQPVGFYSGSQLLEDYFRAVRWLQTVPFRVDRDVELGAFSLLAIDLPRSCTLSYESYFSDYANFLGRPDGSYLSMPMAILPQHGNPKPEPSFHRELERSRTWLKPKREAVPVGLWDSDSFWSTESLGTYHVMAASALPETVVHQHLLGANKSITGLQFVALNGSEWAYSQLDSTQKDPLLDKAILSLKSSREEFGGGVRLYSKFQDVVFSLFEKPDRDAPPFMMTEAWAAKSGQTALASWTQLRHTFTLQTKISADALGATNHPPGFIEPNPAFLRAFVRLVQAAERELEKFDVFKPNPTAVAESLLEKAAWCEAYVSLSKQMTKRKFQETSVYSRVDELFQVGFFAGLPDNGETRKQLDSLLAAAGKDRLQDALPDIARYLRKVADDYRKGRVTPPKNRGDAILKSRWQNLERLSSRMEMLLQKQLRGIDWNEDEASVIKEYGGEIAYIMGYFGNVHNPQDDSPRWVEIADFLNRGTLLAAATGRPRVFYVLYPWKGIEVLCAGSVIPYFEYEGSKRLTDAEWTETLGTPKAPAIPRWARPLYGDPEKKAETVHE